MTNEEAIKYLQQLYPNGGHCWLDEQRIEAIGMAVKALQEEPSSEDLEKAAKEYAIEQVLCSTDTRMTEQAYLGIRLFNGYDLACAYKDGAENQREQMMKQAIDGEVGYWNLHGLSVNVKLPHSVEEGDKAKVIVIKED